MQNGATQERTITEAELRQFTGTETYHPVPFSPRYWMTDGVSYMVREAGGFWLVAHILASQLHPAIATDPELQSLQFWKLSLEDNRSGSLKCLKDTDDIVLSHRVSCEHFPLQLVTLYLQRGVLLLPSEY